MENLNYKTVRYPGHRDLVKMLIRDLRLGQRREILKDVLEASVPMTRQDVVLVFVTVSGMQDGRLTQESFAKKIYSKTLGERVYSAIQITTAAGVCAMVDLVREGALPAAASCARKTPTWRAFSPTASAATTRNAAGGSAKSAALGAGAGSRGDPRQRRHGRPAGGLREGVRGRCLRVAAAKRAAFAFGHAGGPRVDRVTAHATEFGAARKSPHERRARHRARDDPRGGNNLPHHARSAKTRDQGEAGLHPLLRTRPTGQGSDPMNDQDCGRHAKSHHGSALPETQSGGIDCVRQSAPIRFCCRTDAQAL